MSRPTRVLLELLCALGAAALLAACGTQKIKVASSSPFRSGAVLFSQRCSGCHTLAYAGTRGSAANVRTAMMNNGPNFDVRCERPITRVLYAIQNGGFSGAIMPQNIVVGPDAKAVAAFVSEYAGRKAPSIVGQVPCESQPIGSLPSPSQSATTASGTGAGGNSSGPGQGVGPTTNPRGRAGANVNTGIGSTVKQRSPVTKK